MVIFIGLLLIIDSSNGAILATTKTTTTTKSAASDPSIIYWKKTTGNGTGYGAGLKNNVYKVQYSSSYVYGKYLIFEL